MNQRNNLFFFLIFLLPFTKQGQEKFPLFKAGWVSFAGGGIVRTGFPVDTSDIFLLLRKENSLPHHDLSSYQKKDKYDVSGGSEIAFSLTCKLRKKDGSGYRERGMARFAVNYSTGNFLYSKWEDKKAIRFDTLTSQSGQSGPVYIDSVFSYSYKFSYNVQLAGISFALLTQSDPEKLLGLYGGLELGQYFSLVNTVKTNYTEDMEILQTNASGQSSSAGYSNTFEKINTSSTVEGKACYVTRLWIPAGGTLRLAKTKPVLKNIQLFFESRPGLEVASVSGYRTLKRSLANFSFGIRVRFF